LSFATAAEVGFEPAQLNLAAVQELEDRYEESVHSLRLAIEAAEQSGLPSYHIRIKAATVLPRIIQSEVKLSDARAMLEAKLDELLAAEPPYTDNSPPSDAGFSLGYHLAFHGSSNLQIKKKLSRVYERFCPALTRAVFLDLDSVMGDHSYQLDLYKAAQQHPSLPSVQSSSTPTSRANESGVIRIAIVSRFLVAMHPVSIFTKVRIMTEHGGNSRTATPC